MPNAHNDFLSKFKVGQLQKLAADAGIRVLPDASKEDLIESIAQALPVDDDTFQALTDLRFSKSESKLHDQIKKIIATEIPKSESNLHDQIKKIIATEIPKAEQGLKTTFTIFAAVIGAIVTLGSFFGFQKGNELNDLTKTAEKVVADNKALTKLSARFFASTMTTDCEAILKTLTVNEYDNPSLFERIKNNKEMLSQFIKDVGTQSTPELERINLIQATNECLLKLEHLPRNNLTNASFTEITKVDQAWSAYDPQKLAPSSDNASTVQIYDAYKWNTLGLLKLIRFTGCNPSKRSPANLDEAKDFFVKSKTANKYFSRAWSNLAVVYGRKLELSNNPGDQQQFVAMRREYLQKAIEYGTDSPGFLSTAYNNLATTDIMDSKLHTEPAKKHNALNSATENIRLAETYSVSSEKTLGTIYITMAEILCHKLECGYSDSSIDPKTELLRCASKAVALNFVSYKGKRIEEVLTEDNFWNFAINKASISKEELAKSLGLSGN